MGDAAAAPLCRDCGCRVTRTGSRGTWPTRCSDCKLLHQRAKNREANRLRRERFPEFERARVRAAVARDPERNRARVRAWQAANPERVAAHKANATSDQTRNWYLRYAYGITLADQQQMLAAQDGACLICSDPLTPENLAVDHDHTSGEVRGLLCRECNRSLSKAERDPAWLLRAFEYLTATDRPWLPAAPPEGVHA